MIFWSFATHMSIIFVTGWVMLNHCHANSGAQEGYNDDYAFQAVRPVQVKVLHYKEAKSERQSMQTLLKMAMFPQIRREHYGKERSERAMTHALSVSIKTMASDLRALRDAGREKKHPHIALFYTNDAAHRAEREGTIHEKLIGYALMHQEPELASSSFSLVIDRIVMSPLQTEHHYGDFLQYLSKIMRETEDPSVPLNDIWISQPHPMLPDFQLPISLRGVQFKGASIADYLS